jgi:hypothetical protein
MKKLVIPFLFFLFLLNTVAAQDVVLKKGRYIISESGKNYTGIYKEYDSEKNLFQLQVLKTGY